MTAQLIARVVKGPHAFDYVDPETKERRFVEPGNEVMVSRETALSFKDVLIDPAVLAAQAAAEEVLASVEESLNDDDDEDED